jgi:hypothetical protein
MHSRASPALSFLPPAQLRAAATLTSSQALRSRLLEAAVSDGYSANALTVPTLPLLKRLRQLRRVSIIQHASAVRVLAAYPRHTRFVMDFQRSNLTLFAASGCCEVRGDALKFG